MPGGSMWIRKMSFAGSRAPALFQPIRLAVSGSGSPIFFGALCLSKANFRLSHSYLTKNREPQFDNFVIFGSDVDGFFNSTNRSVFTLIILANAISTIVKLEVSANLYPTVIIDHCDTAFISVKLQNGCYIYICQVWEDLWYFIISPVAWILILLTKTSIFGYKSI